MEDSVLLWHYPDSRHLRFSSRRELPIACVSIRIFQRFEYYQLANHVTQTKLQSLHDISFSSTKICYNCPQSGAVSPIPYSRSCFLGLNLNSARNPTSSRWKGRPQGRGMVFTSGPLAICVIFHCAVHFSGQISSNFSVCFKGIDKNHTPI